MDLFVLGGIEEVLTYRCRQAADDRPDPTLAPAWDEKRPGSVMTCGVLNVAFGVLGALVNPAWLALFFVLAWSDPDDPSSARIIRDPSYRVFLVAGASLATIACLVQFASGIGLLRGRRWGWRLAIGYAVFSLVFPVAEFLIDYAMATHVDIVQAGRAGGRDEVLSQVATEATFLIYNGLTMIYPAILLYVMTRKDVRRWFSRRNPAG